MQKYDVTLKLLLQGPARLTARVDRVRNREVADVELPKVQNPRANLLGETADGGRVHLELQCGNDAAHAVAHGGILLRSAAAVWKISPRQ